MKKLIYLLTLLLTLLVCIGCADSSGTASLPPATAAQATAAPEMTEAPAAAPKSTAAPKATKAPKATAVPKATEAPAKKQSFSKNDVSDAALRYAESVIEKDGVYTTPAMVAAYIDRYNKLPSNYITKKEAQSLGWDSSSGNLDAVAKGKSIGGDSFGNREGKLPKGKKYKECDVNYEGGYRGAERLIFSTDGDVYYTNDHYNSFTKLY